MKKMIYQAAYFLRETKIIIKLNLLSNIFSLLSTGLILFMLAMVVSAWWMSGYVIDAIQGEAEINVYFEDGLEPIRVLALVENIEGVKGVRSARVVEEEEAYKRMEKILGKEAHVLDFFDDNPFSAFIEVKIHLEEIEPLLQELEGMTGIEYVRDNREVLDRLQHLAHVLRVVGYMAVAAVGLTTLVIVSHMIRQGIYHNREQIRTLRLLGAPESFIALPFLLEGLCLTMAGGILAAILAGYTLTETYQRMMGPLPFIPLPPLDNILSGLAIIVISLSAFLGLVGGVFGLASARSH